MGTCLRAAARQHPYLLICTSILLACSLPTGDVCGCPPAVSSVIVSGRVQDTARGVLRGVRVEFSATPPTRPDSLWRQSDLVSGTPVFTDSLGHFRTRLLGASALASYLLRMRVVRVGLSDTVTVLLGDVRFARPGEPPDSLFVPVVVP